jgi:predicted  nucleic acid-binding Zn-ribbon protein
MAFAHLLFGRGLLSTSLKISFNELNDWLEGETNTVLMPVHAKAERLLDEMREAHQDLVEVCRMLLESSRKEIEKRNMRTFKRAQALNKLAKLFLERMQPLKVPEKPSFKDVEGFVGSAQKAYAVTDVDVRNWFPRISPFFIMDRGKFLRAFENAKGTLKELNDFLTKEYVKAKALEETFQLIEEVNRLKERVAALKEERKRVKDEKGRIEEESACVQRKIVELEKSGGLSHLAELDEVIDALRKEVEYCLRHLQKPLIKLQSLASHGEGSGLTPEELKKLNQYLADPFEALATENVDYPLLRQILHKTLRLMAEGKLKLKPEKERKAKQAIDEILGRNSLASLHQKCADARQRKAQISASSTLAEARSEMAKLNEQMDRLKKKAESLEAEMEAAEKGLKDVAAKIFERKSRMEKNILNFSGKKVEITIEV